ncbi:MAG TPA: carboxypeptidase regulatory-like domain-containing protein, partial [Candidatus Polarisedimenticolia bacterium]|nr:carboxypeptidase regulatory-like domain-containing protein [Candidatus Polarisedimenticolia bacterium]
MRRTIGWVLSAFAVCAVALTATRAADDATLTGKVLDALGRPLPGAGVILRNREVAFQEQGTITHADGEFRFLLLPPGPHYELTVSLAGYTTIIFSDLSLESGRTLVQNVALRPATDLKETVRVQGKSQTLDTEKVTASTTFTSEFIAELPILGRDYQDILTLAPGVTDVNGTGNPNIHGARDTDVVTLVDGVSTTDPFTGYFGQNLNIESIQELEVITSAATAQYSRAQGGFANILTKSGSNEFAGTFKLFVRSGLLDGDGAGLDDPELTGGFQGDKVVREQHFTDLMPFLSVSGRIVADRLWYYLAAEYIHQETPVNALTHAFVTPVYGYRGFFKTTWQMHASHRLAFSVILDKEHRENEGIDSLADAESGYYLTRGGPTLTLRESAVFSPTRMLESAVSWFDNRFSQNPTTDPDTNDNGVLYIDDHPEWGGNGNGIFDARERDPGEDWDDDRHFDVYEDINFNNFAEGNEDLDGDGRVRASEAGCEGYGHEDLNCNGRLDSEIDANLNGTLDPQEDVGIRYYCDQWVGYCPSDYVEGTRGNGRYDTEDRNGNGRLDVVGDSGMTTTPFWIDANGNGRPESGEYRMPLAPDRDLGTDLDGRTTGPAVFEYHDHRTRFSWLEDFSLYVGEAAGTHDLKVGGSYEHEGYDSDTFQRPVITYPSGSKGATRSRTGDPAATRGN